jgi:hypothetical protein
VLAHYSFLMELIKWCKQVVFHVFDLAMVNTTHKMNRKNPTVAILQSGWQHRDVGQEIRRHLRNIPTSRQTAVQFSVPNSSIKKRVNRYYYYCPVWTQNPDRANSYTKKKYSHFKTYIHATINLQVGPVISILWSNTRTTSSHSQIEM